MMFLSKKHGGMENGMQKYETIWTKKFILFLVMVAFYFLNNYMLNPVLVGYAGSLGGEGAIVGLISGAMSGVALFLTPVVGPLADRFDRKRLTMISFGLLLLANVISLFAPTTEILLAGRIIQGVGFAFASVVLATVVSTMFPNQTIGRAIGVYAAVQALAQVISPTGGILLRDAFGYKAVYVITIVLMTMCLIILLTIRDFGGKLPAREAGRRFSLNSIISVPGIPVALTSVICGFLLQIVTNYVDPFAQYTGHTAGVAFFYTVYALSLLLSRFAFSKAMDRLSLGAFAICCCPVTILAFWLIQVQTQAWVLLLGGVLCAIGLGTLQIVAQVALVKNVSASQKGVANSTYYIAMNLGHFLGGYIGGLWIEGAHAGSMFYYSMLCAVIPIAFALIFRRKYFASPA